jgi:excisionase family DNA binding protein
MADGYLTVNEAAEAARCHHNTIRRAIDAGHLVAFRPAGRILIREEDLRAWIERAPEPTKEPTTSQGW